MQSPKLPLCSLVAKPSNEPTAACNVKMLSPRVHPKGTAPFRLDIPYPVCHACLQYHHLHVLVGGGLRALDGIFEGRFTPAMQEAGAVLSDVATSFHTYHPVSGRWAQPQAAKGPLLIAQVSTQAGVHVCTADVST